MSIWTALVVVLAIIFFGSYGGTLNKDGSLFKVQPLINTPSTSSASNSDIIDFSATYPTATPTPTITTSVQVSPTPSINTTQSKYKDLIYIDHVSRSDDVNNEYIILRTKGDASTTIPVTGWTLRSESTNQNVTIPKGTYLYFADSQNWEENIVLTGNTSIYLITGYSPNGASFKLNKCSGYLSQFQNWNPWLPNSCPAPKNEDLSSIPKTVNNDACFDYIDYMPACRIQTNTLPANWSYECTNFIYTKINYPSCINTHKNDKDFGVNEWRVYLKRNARLWKDRRESIVLIDNEGKIVSRFTY